MSTDFSQKERVFVAQLQAQSGRDLPEWMAAIAGSGLSHRNDIIDWLRQSGFSFAHASWIERIHHNGGRLIYEATAEPGAKRKAKPARDRPARDEQRVAGQRPAAQHSPDADLDHVLAAGKAYRPLAQVLLRAILAAVPGADATAEGDVIVMTHAHVFAALTPSPRDVRLYLALGNKPFDDPWLKARFTGATADKLAVLTHMIVLTDARQLTSDLSQQITHSAQACLGRNHGTALLF